MRSPLRRRTLVLTALALALAPSAVLVACKGKTIVPKLVSVWPKADSERRMAQPPAPPIWPLTGLPAKDAKAVRRRIVSIKVENSQASRPQTNIQRADVVYESLAEGGITRFNCLYHSQQPPIVGPVRSARLSDTWIVPQYDAVFVFAGANNQVTRSLRKLHVEQVSPDVGIEYPFYRTSDKPAPHNFYVRFQRIFTIVKRKKWPTSQKPRPLRFAEVPPLTEDTASSLTIPFSTYQTTGWRYDASSNTYLRSNDGRSHVDKVTGKQVRARNVVVLWTKTSAAVRGRYGATLDIVLGGTGRATLFRDGKRYDGRWEAGRDAPPLLRGADGVLLRLAPGNTWFEVIPSDQNISMR